MIFLIFFLSFQGLVSKAPELAYGVTDVFTKNSLPIQQSDLCELEEQWNEWSNAKSQDEDLSHELCFLYSLGSYQKDILDKDALASVFERLSQLDQSGQTYDLLIHHLYSQEDFAKITNLPIFANLNESLGLDLLLIGACSFDSLGKELDADRYFDFLEKNFSENEQVVHHSVVRLMKKNKYDKALEKINDFLTRANLRPKHAAFYCLKAYILDNYLNKPDEALAVIDDGLELNPRSEKLLRLKFSQLSKTEVTDKSLGVLSSLVNLTGDLNLRKVLITLLAKNLEFEKALDEMEQLGEETFENIYNKAILLIKMNRSEQALPLICECVSQKPERRELQAIYAQLLFDAGKFNQLMTMLLTEFEQFLSRRHILEKMVGARKVFLVSQALVSKIFTLLPKCKNQEKIISSLLSLPGRKDEFFLVSLADYCLAADFYLQASHIYGLLEPLFVNNPRLLAKNFCAVSKIHFAVGNRQYALELLRKALTLCPSLLIGWKLLLLDALQQKKTFRVQKIMSRVQKLLPIQFQFSHKKALFF